MPPQACATYMHAPRLCCTATSRAPTCSSLPTGRSRRSGCAGSCCLPRSLPPQPRAAACPCHPLCRRNPAPLPARAALSAAATPRRCLPVPPCQQVTDFGLSRLLEESGCVSSMGCMNPVSAAPRGRRVPRGLSQRLRPSPVSTPAACPPRVSPAALACSRGAHGGPGHLGVRWVRRRELRARSPQQLPPPPAGRPLRPCPPCMLRPLPTQTCFRSGEAAVLLRAPQCRACSKCRAAGADAICWHLPPLQDCAVGAALLGAALEHPRRMASRWAANQWASPGGASAPGTAGAWRRRGGGP